MKIIEFIWDIRHFIVVPLIGIKLIDLAFQIPDDRLRVYIIITSIGFNGICIAIWCGY